MNATHVTAARNNNISKREKEVESEGSRNLDAERIRGQIDGNERKEIV